MIRIFLSAAASVVALGACTSRGIASEARERPLYFAAAARADDVPAGGVAAASSGPAAAGPPHATASGRGAGRRSRSRSRQRTAAPVARVEAANRAAVREPSAEGYLNASQIYAWSEAAIYRLYAAPEQVSDIALEPGEALISVAAGDTARWVIGDTTSGSGVTRRTHILVKPSATGLRTNLVVTTDRRVYHVQLESTARSAMASVSWTYPQEGMIAFGARQPQPSSVAAGVAIESLNFGYRIDGDRAEWRPVRAFDDGRQVFIEFPPAIDTVEAPPLFVLGNEGNTELVNYRVRGRYYVVDHLFTAAELRLGQRRQQVVRITRTGAAGQRRRGGRS